MEGKRNQSPSTMSGFLNTLQRKSRGKPAHIAAPVWICRECLPTPSNLIKSLVQQTHGSLAGQVTSQRVKRCLPRARKTSQIQEFRSAFLIMFGDSRDANRVFFRCPEANSREEGQVGEKLPLSCGRQGTWGWRPTSCCSAPGSAVYSDWWVRWLSWRWVAPRSRTCWLCGRSWSACCFHPSCWDGGVISVEVTCWQNSREDRREPYLRVSV